MTSDVDTYYQEVWNLSGAPNYQTIINDLLGIFSGLQTEIIKVTYQQEDSPEYLELVGNPVMGKAANVIAFDRGEATIITLDDQKTPIIRYAGSHNITPSEIENAKHRLSLYAELGAEFQAVYKTGQILDVCDNDTHLAEVIKTFKFRSDYRENAHRQFADKVAKEDPNYTLFNSFSEWFRMFIVPVTVPRDIYSNVAENPTRLDDIYEGADIVVGFCNFDNPLELNPDQPVSEYTKRLAQLTANQITLPLRLSGKIEEVIRATEKLMLAERRAEAAKRLGNIAHVIGNTSANMRSAVRLTKTYLKRGDITKAENKLDVLEHQVETVAGVGSRAQQIVQFGVGDEQVVDYNAQINNIVSTFEKECALSGISIETHLDSTIGGVKQRDTYLAIQNLVQNAQHALEAYLKKNPDHPAAITIQTEKTPEGVKTTVSDNGPGMDQKTIDNVLEAKGFTTKPKAHGLIADGYPTILSVCNDNRAQYNLESEIDKGTSFTFTLPS